MKITKARLQEIIKEEIDAVTEAEGPEKALGKWVKMFPRAAAALEKMGATIEDIKKAIDDAHPEPTDRVAAPKPDEFDLGVFQEEIDAVNEEKMISLSLTQKEANDLLIALEAVKQTPEIKALYDKIFDAGLGGGFRE